MSSRCGASGFFCDAQRRVNQWSDSKQGRARQPTFSGHNARAHYRMRWDGKPAAAGCMMRRNVDADRKLGSASSDYANVPTPPGVVAQVTSGRASPKIMVWQ